MHIWNISDIRNHRRRLMWNGSVKQVVLAASCRGERERGAGSEQTEQHWYRTGQAGFL